MRHPSRRAICPHVRFDEAGTVGNGRSQTYQEPSLAKGEITDGERQMVLLLAYVPHIQESSVAGGCNASSLFPSCAIQRGTNFFF